MTPEIQVGGKYSPTISDFVPKIIDPDPAWRADAKCANEDVENFYIKTGLKGRQVKEHIERAIAFCQDCPVKLRCFQYAVDNNEVYGVWGGVHFGEKAPRPRRSQKRVK